MSTLGFLLIALGALIAFEAIRNLTTGSPSASAITSTSSGAGSASSTPSGSQPNVSHSSLPASQLDSTILQALQIAGKPSEWLTGIRNIVLPESSGDPNARNPSAVCSDGSVAAVIGGQEVCPPGTTNYGHAQGLGQTLPPTFAENMVPGHGNILDPLDNLIATINYVARKYGDPSHVCWNQGGCVGGY